MDLGMGLTMLGYLNEAAEGKREEGLVSLP